MASVFSHPAVPLAIAVGLGSRRISARLLWLGIACCIVPDLDFVAFRLGVPFDAALAHRGFTHSLAFALGCGALAAVFARRLEARRWPAFAFIAAVTASHGMLDALTSGGRGIMFFWPFDESRFFWPFRPIEVSPIGIRGFFSEEGARVLWSELKWVWMPAGLVALALVFVRRRV